MRYNYQSPGGMSITGPTAPMSVTGGNIKLILDGTPIQIERFSVDNDPVSGAGMEITATSSPDTRPADFIAWRASAGHLEQDLAEARRDCDTALEMVTRISEWMLNVQPVEDPDIPGLYWCAICSRKITAHESDCPLGTAEG